MDLKDGHGIQIRQHVPQIDPSFQFFFWIPISHLSQSSQLGNNSLCLVVEAIF
ncbi:unnamed protein product [Brassica oleracea]